MAIKPTVTTPTACVARRTSSRVDAILWTEDGRAFGGHALTLLDALKAAVYGWREAGGEAGQKTDAIRKKYQEALVEFRQHCLTYAASPHEKTAALAKEFINDWDAVFRVIDHPWLPLTNNDAERALRH